MIVAGELIEHLSNPGIFLKNMHMHLKNSGRFIITTPNAYALRYTIKHLLSGIVVPNSQHAFYFDYFTLKELCERHDFLVEESYYFFDFQPSFLKNLVYKVFTCIHKSYAPRIMFVLKKK